jgi:hypothetical protein
MAKYGNKNKLDILLAEAEYRNERNSESEQLVGINDC